MERYGSILIRDAMVDDQPEIARLYVELREHHRLLEARSPRYDMGDLVWELEARRALQDPDIHLLVAESQDEGLVGFARLSLEEKVWGLSCEVHTLIVEEASRSAGVGGRLMEAAEAWAVTEGAKGIRVNVLLHNAGGRAFYEREGYLPIAVRYGKALSPGEQES
ncbi:MAG: GNAT family N-acetyltransferase [Actinobacteria bacterium]|nr:GNAT family N-acetyltransferase [Actinomycetota bacterium]